MFKKKKLLVKPMGKKKKLDDNLLFRKPMNNIFGLSRKPKKRISKRKSMPSITLYAKRNSKPRISPYSTAKKSKWNILFKNTKKNKPFAITNPKGKNDLFNPILMTPVPFLRKEKITDKNLTQWGDADMDGSPNQFDCDPRKVWKDAEPLDAQQLLDESAQFERRMKIKELFTKDVGNISETTMAKKIKQLSLSRAEIAKRRKTRAEKERAPRRAMAGLLGAVLPLKALPKEIRKMAKGVYVRDKQAKGTGERGRPSGPSGTYMINGQPIYENEFKKILTIENRKRRLRGMAPYPSVIKSIQTTDEIDPQRLKEMQAKQAVERTQPSSVVQEAPQEYVEEQYTQAQQPSQAQQRYETVEATDQTPEGAVEAEQYKEQQDDNVLHAPNINKGELQSTAGIFQETPETNILNAPQFMKGGLRNVQEEKQMVTVGDGPQSNPYGDEYMEFDPGSGRPILKRRPREKWATGEAI